MRSSRLARRTKVRGFRLAVGSRHSTAALLRAAFAPLPRPNSQTEAQIIRTSRHLALMSGFSRSPACAHRRAYAAGPPSRPQRDEIRGRLYGGFGKFKDTTGRGFRSSLSFPNPPRPSPLGFHRAHQSLRDKTRTQNERTKICQINSQFYPKCEHGRKRSWRIGGGFRPFFGVCRKGPKRRRAGRTAATKRGKTALPAKQ